MNTYAKITLMRKRCDAMLVAMLGAELVPQWWQSKNRAFGDRSPEQQWMDDPESVYRYLLGYIDGYG